MRLWSILIAAALVALVPYGAAHIPTCEEATNADATFFDPYYLVVTPNGMDVWSEENGVPGLQEQSCTDANGRAVWKDSHTAGVP